MLAGIIILYGFFFGKVTAVRKIHIQRDGSWQVARSFIVDKRTRQLD